MAAIPPMSFPLVLEFRLPPKSNLPAPGSARMAWWSARIEELLEMFPRDTPLGTLELYYRNAERDCHDTEIAAGGVIYCSCPSNRYALPRPALVLVDSRGVRHTTGDCAPLTCACTAKHPIRAIGEHILNDGWRHSPEGCAPHSGAS